MHGRGIVFVAPLAALVPNIDFVVEGVSVEAHCLVSFSFVLMSFCGVGEAEKLMIWKKSDGHVDDALSHFGEAAFVVHGELPHFVVCDVFRDVFLFHDDALGTVDELAVL